MESKKVIGYANLNSFNSPNGITNEQMGSFIEKYYEDANIELVDVIVDHCEDTVPLKKRAGWNTLEEKCSEQNVDYVVIPTIQMLGVSVDPILEVSKEFDKKFGTAICAIYEDLAGNDERFRDKVFSYATVRFNQDMLNKKALKMRDVFFRATGIESVSSAVPVYVDYDQYLKAEKVAHDYGLSMRELISTLLTSATLAKNVPILAKELLGIEQEKPMSNRGRPSKKRINNNSKQEK